MHKLDTELSPVTSTARRHDLFGNSLLDALTVPPPILALHLLEVPWLPVEADETRDEQLGALAAGFRFAEGLVEE